MKAENERNRDLLRGFEAYLVRIFINVGSRGERFGHLSRLDERETGGKKNYGRLVFWVNN